MQFYYVNYTILSQEFNNMLNKMKIINQFKLEYEKNKLDWNKKVEASAGDVTDHLKMLS
jgi:hypothetical protein